MSSILSRPLLATNDVEKNDSMTKDLNTLVSELPEIYQTIFGHPEWDGDATRDCNQRLDLITEQYDNLSRALGRRLTFSIWAARRAF